MHSAARTGAELYEATYSRVDLVYSSIVVILKRNISSHAYRESNKWQKCKIQALISVIHILTHCDSPLQESHLVRDFHPFSIHLLADLGYRSIWSSRLVSCARTTNTLSCASNSMIFCSVAFASAWAGNALSEGMKNGSLLGRRPPGVPVQQPMRIGWWSRGGWMLRGNGMYSFGLSRPAWWHASAPMKMKELGEEVTRARPQIWPTAWPGASRR